MMYFRAELVQLIVSWSDSEIWMRKNTLNADPIMLEDELWMRQREKPSLNHLSWFLKIKLEKMSFWFVNLEVSSAPFLEN